MLRLACGMWRSLVSAPALGAGGRGFESRHPDYERPAQRPDEARNLIDRCPVVRAGIRSYAAAHAVSSRPGLLRVHPEWPCGTHDERGTDQAESRQQRRKRACAVRPSARPGTCQEDGDAEGRAARGRPKRAVIFAVWTGHSTVNGPLSANGVKPLTPYTSKHTFPDLLR
jgi:hypothetical protein